MMGGLVVDEGRGQQLEPEPVVGVPVLIEELEAAGKA